MNNMNNRTKIQEIVDGISLVVNHAFPVSSKSAIITPDELDALEKRNPHIHRYVDKFCTTTTKTSLMPFKKPKVTIQCDIDPYGLLILRFYSENVTINIEKHFNSLLRELTLGGETYPDEEPSIHFISDCIYQGLLLSKKVNQNEKYTTDDYYQMLRKLALNYNEVKNKCLRSNHANYSLSLSFGRVFDQLVFNLLDNDPDYAKELNYILVNGKDPDPSTEQNVDQEQDQPPISHNGLKNIVGVIGGMNNSDTPLSGAFYVEKKYKQHVISIELKLWDPQTKDTVISYGETLNSCLPSDSFIEMTKTISEAKQQEIVDFVENCNVLIELLVKGVNNE